MKRLVISMVVLSFLVMVTDACANIIFPSLVIGNTIREIFGWSIIALSLFLEWLCLYFFAGKRLLRSVLVALCMNACSAVVGVLAGMFFTDFQFSYLVFEGRPIAYGVAYFLTIVIVNTLVEYCVARLFFEKMITARRLFFIVLLANVLSVGAGLLGVAIYLPH